MVGYAQHHVPTNNLLSKAVQIEFQVANMTNLNKIAPFGTGFVACTTGALQTVAVISTATGAVSSNFSVYNLNTNYIVYEPVSGHIVYTNSGGYLVEQAPDGSVTRSYSPSSAYTGVGCAATNTSGTLYAYGNQNYNSTTLLSYFNSYINTENSSGYFGKSLTIHTDGYMYSVCQFYSSAYNNYGKIDQINLVSNPGSISITSATVTNVYSVYCLYGSCSHPTNGYLYLTAPRGSNYGLAGAYYDTVYSYGPSGGVFTALYSFDINVVTYPYDIIVGSNGNLFIQEQGTPTTPGGTTVSGITELKIDGTFVKKWRPLAGNISVMGICIGPDKKVWYTASNSVNSYIGRLPY